jgi:hypothetical protein
LKALINSKQALKDGIVTFGNINTYNKTSFPRRLAKVGGPDACGISEDLQYQREPNVDEKIMNLKCEIPTY